ncbi:MAG: TonB-dependent receptor [Tannerellaceae bacterium]|nr:TonB-dependent receptor [Tannerellaceae bacterium]
MKVIFEQMISGNSMRKIVISFFLAISVNVLLLHAVPENRQTGISESTQQTVIITGTVTDTQGDPVVGANVVEKGTSNGIITDIDGKFHLTVNNAQSVLIVSYVGYLSQEITIGSKTEFYVTLIEDSKLIDEIVVIGYGTQRKADVTSAVTSVKAEEFNKGAILDAGQLVQGKVAGLQISLPTGDPVASTSVILRGSTTLQGNRSPLILVDGVPGSFSTVAPEDIESIDVLKDGSATAIYGTRGTNGVIIITTKSRKGDMPSSIDYSGYISISNQLRKADFMEAADLRKRLAEGWSFSGANNQDYGAGINWLDEISRTGVTHVHNLTFRGGGRQTSLLANLTYEERQGTIKKSDVDNMRGRVEVNHRMFDDKLISTVAIIANERKAYTAYNSNLFEDVYRQACIQNPTQPIYDENGDYVERDVYFYTNPVSLLNEREAEYRNRNLRFTGSMEFRPVNDISLKGMYTRKGQSNINGYYLTHNHYTTTEGGYNGSAYRYASDFRSDLAELTASWNKNIGKHTFGAVAGYSYQEDVFEEFYMTNRNFPTDSYSYNNIGSGLGINNGDGSIYSHKKKEKLIALLARVTYNYKDRYLLMASIRHEGSTKFGEEHKWGSFPGISLGWRISEEDIMKSIEWLDNLKIRAGFGITGTNIYDPYQSLASLSYSGYFLYNGSWINTLVPSRNPNPDLKWEKKHEYNAGLDFDFFNGRLGGTIDVYLRDTKDALWDYAVASPPYQYTSIMANAGEIRNSGFELALNVIPVRNKALEWNTGITFSTNKNELRALGNDKFTSPVDYFYAGHTGEPIQQSTHRNKIGRPIGDFWGLKSVGLTENGKWVVERFHRDGEGNITGTYYDLAENADDDDKQILGNGVPTMFLNWNNQVRFRNFDLSISMRGAFDYEILNFQKMYYGNPTIQYNVLNSAFELHPVVDLSNGQPVGQKTTINDSQRYVSEYIEKGDYWKIDNVTIGYTFNLIKSKRIRALRVYASCLNLATFTGYSGIDPEVRMIDNDPGIDSRDKFPTVRSYTFGINATF